MSHDGNRLKQRRFYHLSIQPYPDDVLLKQNLTTAREHFNICREFIKQYFSYQFTLFFLLKMILKLTRKVRRKLIELDLLPKKDQFRRKRR